MQRSKDVIAWRAADNNRHADVTAPSQAQPLIQDQMAAIIREEEEDIARAVDIAVFSRRSPRPSLHFLPSTCRTVSRERSASSSSPTGRSRVSPNLGRASSISSDKYTKPRSSSARTGRSLFTAGELQEDGKRARSTQQGRGLIAAFFLCDCSAGVGRTGVFITLSIVLERMRYEGAVDIFQTVKMLRTQRPAMVQTEVTSAQC